LGGDLVKVIIDKDAKDFIIKESVDRTITIAASLGGCG